MKTLQNNFTTPEQSKRLLELGVPADSADCVFMRGYSSYGKDEFVVPFYKTDSIVSFFKDHEWEDGIDFIPCWSVGRLIEIYEACCLKRVTIDFENIKYVHERQPNLIEDLMECIEGHKIMHELYPYYYKLDFSKLEE